ncbi:ubiquinone/menaquinone biosynthesis C-methylase UbiE [Tepidamorphus gemmatus]|uniref:Ubiquinone/menaquinone biosynthesis C-methylase UbiE n=1 Tax=Tepidamorphus gemmatus TaxID=747076 RepID=A0A4R3MAI3_9HYPH|nr:methyltransferase domain-containing protein [Tepidamorphus gemmatus]TCT10601.1 ubiquinone/menaquinone biosynthesis C-methylase UbiE [Tepidamorphus gemmatus]
MAGDPKGLVEMSLSESPEGSGYAGGHAALLQLLWGQGFLSPGGPEEVERVLDGLDLDGRRVLDIGCGLGGIDRLIAERHRVVEVVGIDVEAPLVEAARRLIAGSPVAQTVRFECVSPGPLPFPAERFDVVFSKDSILHVPDKAALAREIHRVLAPGGVFAASDWLSGREGAPTADMARYLAAEGLGFVLATPDHYRAALEAAGFKDIRFTDRNAWYRDLAAREEAELAGPLRQRAISMTGPDFLTRQLEVWRTMRIVLDSGELRPTHIRARKPAGGPAL